MADCNGWLRILAVCCQDDGTCMMITGRLIGRGPETGLVGRGSPEVHSNQVERLIRTCGLREGFTISTQSTEYFPPAK